MSDELDFENNESTINPEELKNLIKGGIKSISPDKPKKQAKAIVEDKSITSSYANHKFNEEEINSANSLYEDLAGFLKKEVKIQPSAEARSTIPTGIDLLDCVLGGGFVTGLTQVVGMPGSGKSALAAKALATGQRKWPGKFMGVYIDSEESASRERLAELGCQYPQITPYKENTVEAVFKAIEGICAYKEQHPETVDIPYGIIWDSIANTVTEKALTDESHHSSIGLKAAILSAVLPKYVSKLNDYNISLIGINQLRDKIEMGNMPSAPDLRFLPDNNIPGGKSLLYNTVQLLWCRQSDKIKEELYGFPAIKVKAKTIKNKLFTPNIEVDLVFTYQHGFSNFWTNYELLKKFGRISAGAGWVTLDNYASKNKFRQKDTIKVYREDPEFKEAWDASVTDVLEKEYKEKYKPKVEISNTEVW